MILARIHVLSKNLQKYLLSWYLPGWLRLRGSYAGDMGSIPGPGMKIPHASTKDTCCNEDPLCLN